MDGGRRGGGLNPLLNSFGVVTATEGEEESQTDWVVAATALPEKCLCFGLAQVWWKAGTATSSTVSLPLAPSMLLVLDSSETFD